MIRALRRRASLLRLGAGTLLLLPLACGRASGPQIDSESHFLGGCATSCASGLSCICGVCTEPCVEASDCSGAAFGALCRELDAEQCGTAEPAVCDVACALEADCAEVPGATCSGGWCRSRDPSGAIIGAEPNESPREPLSSLPDRNELVAPPEMNASLALPEMNALGAPPDTNEYVWPRCYTRPGVAIEDLVALADFEGCENIYGDLDISFAADLRPLHALRNLFGSLTVHPAVSTQRSLEGLEHLELVQGNAQLRSLEVPSLASLARLRSVGAQPGQGLVLDRIVGLQNLSGLEQLANLHNLSISGAPDLVSIAELHLPSEVERLLLSGVPRLASIDSLRSQVAKLDSLTLTATGLESLGLSLPSKIEQLTVTDNVLLTDTSALQSLGSLRRLQIQGNARLTSIALPTQVSALEVLNVADNPQLGTLTSFTLQTLDKLEVVRNSSLTSIELPLLLAPVLNLVVVSNASLPPDSFGFLVEGVAKAKIGGNQGEATGLAPCPWRRDGYCDAPPTDTLCAPDTDTFDCSTAR